MLGPVPWERQQISGAAWSERLPDEEWQYEMTVSQYSDPKVATSGRDSSLQDTTSERRRPE